MTKRVKRGKHARVNTAKHRQTRVNLDKDKDEKTGKHE